MPAYPTCPRSLSPGVLLGPPGPRFTPVPSKSARECIRHVGGVRVCVCSGVHRFLSRPSCISCRPSPFAILGKCYARPPFGPGSQDQGRLHIRFALSLKDLEQMQQKDWRLGLPGAGHQLVTTSNYIRKTGFRDVRRKRCNSCTACYTCERARGEGGCAADRRGRGWG